MLKKILKNYTTKGLRSSLRNVKQELYLCLEHHRGLRHAQKFINTTGLKLNVGCGKKVKHGGGWINIDICPYADLKLDLREPLPFRSDSCSMIYSEHFLEHIDYPEPALSFLKECYRILEISGIFSVGVPDTELPILEYAGIKDEGYFPFVKKTWHPAWCKTKMEHINYHFRQDGEHRFAYDFDTLQYMLINAGFSEIRRREFNPLLDSEDRKTGTIYAEAIKSESNSL